MTIKDFFDLIASQAEGRSIPVHLVRMFLAAVVKTMQSVPTQSEDWQEFELDDEPAQQLYFVCYERLQLLGMELEGEMVSKDPVWADLNQIAEVVRSTLNMKLGLELPETPVVSVTTVLIDQGFLEAVTLPDGRPGIKPVDDPYGTRIKIVKVPAGGAPEEVRRAWVGVILPARRHGTTTISTNLSTGEFRTGVSGYSVPVAEALIALSQVDKEAAMWFQEHMGQSGDFVFNLDEAEVVTN